MKPSLKIPLYNNRIPTTQFSSDGTNKISQDPEKSTGNNAPICGVENSIGVKAKIFLPFYDLSVLIDVLLFLIIVLSTCTVSEIQVNHNALRVFLLSFLFGSLLPMMFIVFFIYNPTIVQIENQRTEVSLLKREVRRVIAGNLN